MVAAVLSLRVALLRNEWGRSRAQRWMAILMVVALVAGTTVAAVLVASAAGPDSSGSWSVLSGAGLVIGWAAAPVLALGGDGTVSAGTLRGYPVPRADRAIGLLAASWIGLPGVVALAMTVLAAAGWWHRPHLMFPVVAAALVTAITATLAYRCALDGLALMVESRGARERVGAGVLIAAMLALPLWLLLFGTRSPLEVLGSERAVDLIGWTPAGAPWAGVAALDDGRVAVAAGHAVVAGAGVLVAGAIWWWVLGRLAGPAPARGRRRGHRRLGWFGRMPDTVAGAVAARTLTWWSRDPRYSQVLVMALLLPVLGLAMDLLASAPGLVLIMVMVGVLLVTGHAALDLSHDSTAVAAQLSSGVRGRDDRLGRVVAHSLVALLVIVFGWAMAAVRLPASALAPVAGMLIAGAGAALASSAVSSTLITVPTPPPGTVGSRTGSGLPTALLYAIATACALMASIPPVILMVVAVRTGDAWPGLAALGTGIVLAAVALWVGVTVGGRLLDRRGTRLYESLVRLA